MKVNTHATKLEETCTRTSKMSQPKIALFEELISHHARQHHKLLVESLSLAHPKLPDDVELVRRHRIRVTSTQPPRSPPSRHVALTRVRPLETRVASPARTKTRRESHSSLPFFFGDVLGAIIRRTSVCSRGRRSSSAVRSPRTAGTRTFAHARRRPRGPCSASQILAFSDSSPRADPGGGLDR